MQLTGAQAGLASVEVSPPFPLSRLRKQRALRFIIYRIILGIDQRNRGHVRRGMDKGRKLKQAWP